MLQGLAQKIGFVVVSRHLFTCSSVFRICRFVLSAKHVKSFYVLQVYCRGNSLQMTSDLRRDKPFAEQ